MCSKPALLALWLLAGAPLLAVPSAAAGDKKENGKEFRVEGELTNDDAKDKVRKDSFHKVHKHKMVAGKTYRIDLIGRSQGFDAFLRLEDSTGKQLAFDDDSGGNLNSRIIFKAEKDDEYRLIATTFIPNQTGKYTLVITEATAADALIGRAKTIFASPPAEQKQILADLIKHFSDKKDKLTPQDAQIAMEVAQGLEFRVPALAAEAYSGLGKAVAASADPKAAELGQLLEGAGRRITLPGKEMEVKGKTLDGKELDLKSLRGKVVLVDFWATWCGPCRAEFPNMKAMLEKYREKGFEILGVSVDANTQALEKFLDAEKLPWTSIHDRAPEGMGPLSKRYGILSIPQAILVDREGRVVSLNARGQELGRLLEQHIGKGKEK